MEKKDNQNRQTPIPDNNPSKAMDSKREVEQSNDKKTDQDFPGYPHYPAKEDIMDLRTGSKQVDVDVENLPNNKNATGVSQRFAAAGKSDETPGTNTQQKDLEEDDLEIIMGTDADVDEDDLAILNSTDAEIGTPQNVSNEDENDLDVPGSELDDNNESIGEEDEENNYYSLGGDRHDSLEENQTAASKTDND